MTNDYKMNANNQYRMEANDLYKMEANDMYRMEANIDPSRFEKLSELKERVIENKTLDEKVRKITLQQIEMQLSKLPKLD